MPLIHTFNREAEAGLNSEFQATLDKEQIPAQPAVYRKPLSSENKQTKK